MKVKPEIISFGYVSTKYEISYNIMKALLRARHSKCCLCKNTAHKKVDNKICALKVGYC